MCQECTASISSKIKHGRPSFNSLPFLSQGTTPTPDSEKYDDRFWLLGLPPASCFIISPVCASNAERVRQQYLAVPHRDSRAWRTQWRWRPLQPLSLRVGSWLQGWWICISCVISVSMPGDRKSLNDAGNLITLVLFRFHYEASVYSSVPQVMNFSKVTQLCLDTCNSL